MDLFHNLYFGFSVAVTPITFGSAAGNSAGDFGPLLPTAATRMRPRTWAAALLHL